MGLHLKVAWDDIRLLFFRAAEDSVPTPVASQVKVVFGRSTKYPPKDKDGPKSNCEQEMSQGQTRLRRQGCVPRTPALPSAKLLWLANRRSMNRTPKFFLYVLAGILGVALGVLFFLHQCMRLTQPTPTPSPQRHSVPTYLPNVPRLSQLRNGDPQPAER